MLRADLCDFSDAYIVVKWDITVTEPNDAKGNKIVTFKNNALFIKNQWCTNWQCRRSRCNVNVHGIITETNQVILFLLILNLLNTRQVLQ